MTLKEFSVWLLSLPINMHYSDIENVLATFFCFFKFMGRCLKSVILLCDVEACRASRPGSGLLLNM